MDARNDGAVTPVLLNVYDLTPVNDYLYWLGFGVFHSGIEVHGVEYGFGAHGFPSSGVFEVGSKSCPGFVYRRSVWLGTTDMSQEEFRSFIEKLAGKYHGNSYHLISKNCNHFTDDVCKNLTGKPIPGWVNRLARVGSFFDCLLPESVQVSPVGRVPTLRPISGVTISFALAGAACVLNALCYAELASRFPAVVGGAYLYTYSAFNEITAFLVFTQLMLDYHIAAASIARSLASYSTQFLELIPFLKGHIPSWIGHGEEFFGGVVSINILAPILLVILTAILCYGVKESSAVNTFMTTLKIVIVVVVVFAGVFKVDVSNWSPFMPNGFKGIVTGATVVFFAYVGFDAVANSAEEAKKPQRDLPIGILGSLLACVILYVAVCLVITGMVPYTLLGEDAPLAEAFAAKGLKFVTVLISIGAVAGLTTTLLVGLYVQSRLYLGLGRDGLLPSIFAKVHPARHTPLHSQIWVGCVVAVLSGLFNVHMLSHILSVGTLTGYSAVSACVITLRWNDKATNRRSLGSMSIRQEGVLCLVLVALCGFVAGLCYRFSYAIAFMIAAFLIAIIAGFSLQFRQVYVDPPGFSCPGVPVVPVFSVFFNMFLFAQLHEEAWYRFVILSLVAVGVYAGYGQYNAAPSSSDHSTVVYHGVPSEAP